MINKIKLKDRFKNAFKSSYTLLLNEELPGFFRLMIDEKTGRSKFKETRYIEYALTIAIIIVVSFVIWLWI